MWVLESKGLLASEQCGFRKKRSTADQLVRFDSFIRNAFAKQEHVLAIFFDLEKAYDTRWKHGILSDLYDLDIRGHFPTFTDGLLSHRLFQVRAGSTLSDTYEQEMGVPQGSILSPILFTLKINNIFNSVLKGLEASLFVDDFALCIYAKFLPHAQRLMQLCVNSVQDWVSKNYFKFSTSKTVCMHFCNQRKHFAEPSILLDKTPIKVVTEAKFLGVTFDRTLSCSSHVKYLKTNCLKTLDILKVVGHPDWGANQKTLCLYRALVRSKLDYGSIVYGAASNHILKKLDPIHHQGLRIALGAFRTASVTSLYAKAKEMSLKNRRMKISMNYVLKLKICPDNPAYSCVFEPPNLKLFKKSNLTSLPPNSTTV